MNITIASLAIIASLSNINTLPGSATQVVPAQTNTFSKDELVQIITSEQKAIQTLENFIVSLPTIDLANDISIDKAASRQSNRASFIMSKKIVSTGE